MEGLVAQYGCDAILCPEYTFNKEGRQTSNNTTCAACPNGDGYLGSVTCDPTPVPTASPSVMPTKLGSPGSSPVPTASPTNAKNETSPTFSPTKSPASALRSGVCVILCGLLGFAATVAN
mmetsp:Transcript_29555/g.87551  ORF Transcript_29555/g.87551 Transcript_29555/m.87551 type:complete len:120 (-) Transcript_29555:81-440(-)